MTKLKFIWIDDDKSRQKSAIHLEKQLGVKCIFVDVEPEDVDFLSLIGQNDPDLILLDHNLPDIGTGEIKKGSTIAALIREKHPTYAIACITSQNGEAMDSQQRGSYEAVFSYSDIKSHYLSMESIAVAFRKMKANPPKKLDDLFTMLKAPSDELNRLETILPREIKENLKDRGIYSQISHWVRNVLMERPGFLYDRLWAATLLGLNENGFEKVEGLFTPALFKGIFSDDSRQRWWKSELISILAKQVKDGGLPWEKGRKLNGINSRNYSKDYYSNYKEDYPEVVAFTDDTSNERAQMKIRNTVLHPKFDKLLFFEDIRVMKTE